MWASVLNFTLQTRVSFAPKFTGERPWEWPFPDVLILAKRRAGSSGASSSLDI